MLSIYKLQWISLLFVMCSNSSATGKEYVLNKNYIPIKFYQPFKSSGNYVISVCNQLPKSKHDQLKYSSQIMILYFYSKVILPLFKFKTELLAQISAVVA